MATSNRVELRAIPFETVRTASPPAGAPDGARAAQGSFPGAVGFWCDLVQNKNVAG
jgi:hypothetical protein